MVNDVYVTVVLEPVSCHMCGVTFGMARDFKNQRHTDGETFYCPAGHGMVYRETTKQELERVRGQLAFNRELLAAESRNHEATANKLRGTKGALTRTKRRANAGVCLDCHRTFVDVVRHREKMHPEGGAMT